MVIGTYPMPCKIEIEWIGIFLSRFIHDKKNLLKHKILKLLLEKEQLKLYKLHYKHVYSDACLLIL